MLQLSNNKNIKRVNSIVSIVIIISAIALSICGLIAGGARM